MITTRPSEIFANPVVSIRSNSELSSVEQEYFFGAPVKTDASGLVIAALNDREDAEFFYKRLKSWAEASGLQLYLLRVGSDVSKKSEFRSKMSLRKEIPLAHRENAVRFEVEGQNGESRLAVIGPLNEDAGFSSLEALLNWMYSIVIVSEFEIGHVTRRAEAWINTAQSSFLGFDFSRVLDDVACDSDFVICRFFPGGNGRSAALSMLFNARSLGL